MKKTICIFLLLTSSLSVYAETQQESQSCDGIKGNKDSNLCKLVTDVCSQYNKPDKKIVQKFEEYSIFEEYRKKNDNVDAPFTEAQKAYKTNMARIYECGMLNVKQKTLVELKEKVKATQPLKEKIDSYIEKKEKEIEKAKEYCIIKDKKESQIDKRDFLYLTTYETCKYQTYLEYLRTNYYNRVKNLVPSEYLDKDGNLKDVDSMPDTGKSIIASVIESQYTKLREVSEEISHTRKVYAQTYRTFLGFESNYPIHIFFEIIKIDLQEYKTQLKGVLGPLSQLVGKIINAMETK